MLIPDTPACVRAHVGLWAIEPLWLQQALRAVQMQAWPVLDYEALQETARQSRQELLYNQIDQVALIRIVDQMQKGISKFGGTSTIATRRAIGQALEAEDITAIFLAIDSPGGMVAGTLELAEAVRQATLRKPVAAYVEDLGASAAYWVASQATRLTANAVAQLGSIGVVAEIVDSSGMAEREGLKIHIRSTGPYKGLGAPGTPVPEALLEEIDGIVQGIGQQFFQAVQRGRKLNEEQLAAVTTGQVWLAPQARRLGLIDGIESFDAAFQAAKALPAQLARAKAEQAQGQLTARQVQLHAALCALQEETTLCHQDG